MDTCALCRCFMGERGAGARCEQMVKLAVKVITRFLYASGWGPFDYDATADMSADWI